jgi:predicted O-methyltransferase YrrM
MIAPEAILSAADRLWLRDEDFRQLVESFSMRPRQWDRWWLLGQLAELATDVPGDTVEVGVYHGYGSALICRSIAGAGKTHHAFDSWEGLPHPEPRDGTHWSEGDFATDEHAARELLRDFDFVRFYKGWVPDRFPEVADRQFSLVHIDVDLYQPTLDSIEFFWPVLAAGGVMVLDDYGLATCPGAHEAAERFFRDKDRRIVHVPTGQGVIFNFP